MKIFLFTILSTFFLACGGTTDKTKLFDIQFESKKKQFKKNESVAVSIKNKQNLNIKKVDYFIDGKKLSVKNGKINFNIDKLGSKILIAKIDFEDDSVDITKKIKILAEKSPEIYTYEILNTYPHDKTSFTQGLEFKNDTLYEGTGRKGKSRLRKIDYKTGQVLQEIALDDSVFGEGLTVLEDKIYQLTWQSGLGYVYNKTNLSKIKTFSYGKSKEGWGLCNDGQKIYKSDGTEKIWILDPANLTETDFIETVTNKSIFNKANELEYVDGKIYANVWQKESMMIIDSKSGAIEGVINFGGLKEKVEQHPQVDVLNGVAYHPERKTFFVTGKNWDKLFEVNIIKK
ncbi:glutaminyl-peptide cyclotransferase [Croceitalea sp. MTPC9]|uniref:glutaminyl-peptide cyclotransferase n=1 Tax=unclassified Croceitalea TaxID=2632280 RepID=UPI002B3A77FB|nr:glutaminyl-peptide cyclotransferase [Croceitalea sp. MTPC6]GMN15526.1 glutaminyl-peptide cyclotransferase [Croceitalea sp. MTPC9]